MIILPRLDFVSSPNCSARGGGGPHRKARLRGLLRWLRIWFSQAQIGGSAHIALKEGGTEMT